MPSAQRRDPQRRAQQRAKGRPCVAGVARRHSSANRSQPSKAAGVRAPTSRHGAPATNWTPVRLASPRQQRWRNAGNIDANRAAGSPRRPRHASTSSSGRRIASRRSDGERRALAGAHETGAIERRCAPAPAAVGRLREIAFQQDPAPAHARARRRGDKCAHPCVGDDRHAQRAVGRLRRRVRYGCLPARRQAGPRARSLRADAARAAGQRRQRQRDEACRAPRR